MRRLAWMVLVALLSACATPGPDSVEHAKDVNESIPMRVSEAGSVFIVEMVDGRLMDIEQGELATARATRSDVMAYAQRAVIEQTALLKQLNDLATRSRVTVPIVIGADKRDGLKDLQALEGVAFDKAYVKSLREGHERDLAKCHAATALDDVVVSRFAAAQLSVIEAQLAEIEALAKAR